MVIRIYKSSPGSDSRFITVNEDGIILEAYSNVADIVREYARETALGIIKLQYETDTVYKP